MAFARTSTKPSAPFMPRFLRHGWVCTMLALAITTQAQTLAHRNWVGNGLTTTAWWQNAVFYSLNIDTFQDSDGDGEGDIPGLIQRLDYLQSLGIDAIELRATSPDEHFDELIRAANARHMRVVMDLFPMPESSRDIVGVARQWLTHGAAGIHVFNFFTEKSPLGPSVVHELRGPEQRPPLKELRHLVDSFPGDRVLIVSSAYGDKDLPSDVAHLVVQTIGLNEPLVSQALKAPHPENIPIPHGSLPLAEQSLGHLIGLVQATDVRAVPMQKIAAAFLLLRPGAILLQYGDELTPYRNPVNPVGRKVPVMSWTPTNLTTTPKPEEPSPASNAPDPTTYKADNYTGYTPYIAPKPKPKPRDLNAPPDPATLPGFSTKASADLSPNIATANVATEDADPLSVLNFYRHLSQLHHDHPALRGGELTDIDLSAQQAFAWVIKAPAATRTAHNILVVANFSDKPQRLNLDEHLLALHLHPGGLRPLLASYTTTPPFQYSQSLTLPPFSVYVAEL